jgi:hypothetical protein
VEERRRRRRVRGWGGLGGDLRGEEKRQPFSQATTKQIGINNTPYELILSRQKARHTYHLERRRFGGPCRVFGPTLDFPPHDAPVIGACDEEGLGHKRRRW